MKGRYTLNLLRQRWSKLDRVRSQLFPRRTTVTPGAWTEELMTKRFGALFVCGSCAVKYGDALRRWAYVRHPDKAAQGNACDFCKQVNAYLPVWFTEERRPPTAQQLYEESRRYGVAGAPHLYDRRFA